MIKSLLTPIAACIVLSGCAIGQGNFSCDGLPEGITCMSASQVYNETHGRERVGKASSDKTREVVTRTVTLGGVTPPPDRPTPVRTEPEVLRVLVFPWEDDSQRLNIGGYVFSEVTPRKWSVGEVPHASTRVLHSINDSSVRAAPTALTPLQSSASQPAAEVPPQSTRTATRQPSRRPASNNGADRARVTSSASNR